MSVVGQELCEHEEGAQEWAYREQYRSNLLYPPPSNLSISVKFSTHPPPLSSPLAESVREIIIAVVEFPPHSRELSRSFYPPPPCANFGDAKAKGGERKAQSNDGN